MQLIVLVDKPHTPFLKVEDLLADLHLTEALFWIRCILAQAWWS